MTPLTPRIMATLCGIEGVCLEAYLDSRNVWTWGPGIAATSGFNVLQYKDRPSTLDTALKAAITLVETKFLPVVLKAFTGHPLTENQLAAALSFHWNTGEITKAQWVKDVMAGKPVSARADLTGNYLQGGLLTDRREFEAALFFDAAWPEPPQALVYAVRHPSYKQGKATKVDVLPTLQQIMGGV